MTGAGLRILLAADTAGSDWSYSLDLARGLSRLGVETILALLGPSPSAAQRVAAASVPMLEMVETGLAPTINTGIAHREPGVGQVGAGIVKAPLKCFQDALVAFAETMNVE